MEHLKSMKIAIIGAGFAGVATAWHLLQLQKKHAITLFDPKGIAGGASGIAAGLLHCFAGANAKLNWMGREGMHATSTLLKIAEEALDAPVCVPSGFLRVALTDQQQKLFRQSSEIYEDVDWWDAKECENKVLGIANKPGIFIRSALTVYPHLYLQGLWLACEKRGAAFSNMRVQSLQELNHFDCVIVTAGASTLSFSELSHLPLTMVKGQLLELAWPEGLPLLPFPLNSQAYLVINPDGKSCVAGATFEKQFVSTSPDLETAILELTPKIEALYPPLTTAKILTNRSGVRVSAPRHHPFMEQINERLWVLTGLGSKGLLYHALMASKLARSIS
jgi:glycine/D-amino acid oxidase-like deaminating enzyme